MARVDRAHSIEDLRILARRRLPHSVFHFIDGGAGDERTLRENRSDFDAWRLWPRAAVNVATRSTATRILDIEASLPLMLAPTGLGGLYAPRGEILAARAAAAAGVPLCLSTNSVMSLEEVATAVPSLQRWFQLYVLKDRPLMWSMLDRAKAHGYRTLCLTVDLAVQGRRERDLRNAFAAPLKPRLRTLLEVASRPGWVAGYLKAPVRFGNYTATSAAQSFMSVAQFVATLFDPTADWDTIAEVRDYWKGPFVIKGVLHPDDARRAVELGAAAVIVSNHGGRQLDQVPSSIAALPGVAAAVGGRAQVLLDSGVRRGLDVIKAKALGADACLIGRAFLWGLAAGGEAGVARTLAILREEIDNAMVLLGVSDFSRIGPEVLAPAGPL